MSRINRKNEKFSDISPICAYCEKASALVGGENFLCPKKGVVPGRYGCRAFSYDPLKRIPAPSAPLITLTAEEAEL